MAELMIVRHGQASFGAENYDQLSDLGVRQAKVLGAYLRGIGWEPDRLVTGTLARQTQTLDALGFKGVREEHAGFNEYNLDGFRKSQLNRVAMDGDRKAYFRGLRDLVLEWQKDADLEAEESWRDFCDRTEAAMAFATETDARRVLVVSSGGVIGQVVRSALKAPPPMMMELNLQVKNTSFTRILFSGQRRMLQVFNAAPHLDAAPDLLSYA
jgi:broad specificity phosphatase PhoE